MSITRKYLLVLAGVAGLFANTSQDARAAFELNFLPASQGPDNAGDVRRYASCNMGAPSTDAFCQRADSTPDPDKTPFLREYVTIDGVQYIHMIVGSLTPNSAGETFVQETYTRLTNTGQLYSNSGGRPGCDADNLRCGGGASVWTSGNGQVVSNGALGTPLVGNQHATGIGTGDPTRTIIRQVMLSSEMNQEFLKADFLLKPKITQSINVSGINGLSSQFVLDMSALNYSTIGTGTLVNTLTLNDPSLPAGSNFFDVGTSSQSANVTGGRYTFTAGTGWVDRTVRLSYFTPGLNGAPPVLVPEDNVWQYNQGGYAYSNGGVDLTNVDWQAFRNPLENP